MEDYYNELSNLKKKILFRSYYRGTKELDLVIKYFIDNFLDELNEKILIDLDSLLNKCSEHELYNCFIKNKNFPLWVHCSLVEKISISKHLFSKKFF